MRIKCLLITLLFCSCGQKLDCELKQGDKVIETLYDKEVVIEESFPGVRYEVCGCCWHSFSIDGVVIDTFSQSAFIKLN